MSLEVIQTKTDGVPFAWQYQHKTTTMKTKQHPGFRKKRKRCNSFHSNIHYGCAYAKAWSTSTIRYTKATKTVILIKLHKPYLQVVQQEQEQDPTTDHLVHVEELLSFYQKQGGSVPQQQLSEASKILKSEIIWNFGPNKLSLKNNKYPSLSFRREALHTMSVWPVLSKMRVVLSSWGKKLSYIWLWTIRLLHTEKV